MGKSSQNNKYEKSYFQGPNFKDQSITIKFPDKTSCKNTVRKSKRKK